MTFFGLPLPHSQTEVMGLNTILKSRPTSRKIHPRSVCLEKPTESSSNGNLQSERSMEALGNKTQDVALKNF